MAGVKARQGKVARLALVLTGVSIFVAAGCGEAFEDGSPQSGGAGAGGVPIAAGNGGQSEGGAGVGSVAEPAAGGGVGGVAVDDGAFSGAGGLGEVPELPDTTPPTIVSVQPSKGASGVDANTALEITFSEPMAKAQTQSAYQSASVGIKPSEVVFSWDAAGTVLTVKPNAALTYATGTQPGAVAAFVYDYFVSTAAEDRAGNSLASTYAAQFKTLRRIEQRLLATSSLSGTFGVTHEGEFPVTEMYVGCLEANEVYRVFVSFNLQPMPEGIVQFESASLEMFQSYQASIDRTPFEALGDLEVHGIDYATRNRAAFDALDAAGLNPIGKFGTSAAVGYKSVLVTATLAADYKRRSVSQYGIKFHTKLNTDGHHDIVYFDDPSKANPPRLVVSYLVP